MGKKIIKLTESDLTNIVKRVINEQKKVDVGVGMGQTSQGKLSNDTMILMDEGLNQYKFLVKTKLPQGKFMFEHGEDGKYYGYDSSGKKHEIIVLKKL
jgi:hypothetical protein